MLYVLSRSVGQSRAAGFASAFGLALGGMLLAIATAFGLAALFAQMPQLVTILRYAGSLYLVWLGIGMIANARAPARHDLPVRTAPHASLPTIVGQGVMVELLNPKTVLFFALFLPPFVDPGTAHLSDANMQSQLLVLGILVPLTAIPSDTLVACMGSAVAQNLNRNQGIQKKLAWAAGLTLCAIAINLQINIL